MNVLVTIRLPEEVLAPARKEHHVEMNPEDMPMERRNLLDGVADKEGLLCSISDRIDEELLSRAKNLKVIANYGVGFDHIDLHAASRRGIPVTNTPGVLTDATADLAFTLILASARRVVEGDGKIRRGDFGQWAPFNFLGRQVSGRALGIVGFGRIGKAVAKRAAGFDMRVLYHSRTRIEREEEKRLGVEYASFDGLLGESDFVTLHVPFSPETYRLIGARELGLMKPTAILINTSRGPVVDEAALVDALRSGRIGGAGLDVYEREPELAPGLSDMWNATLLPHVGSATHETRAAMGVMAVNCLTAALRGERPPNCLNCSELGEGKS